jgi:hypothetical protein
MLSAVNVTELTVDFGQWPIAVAIAVALRGTADMAQMGGIGRK